MEWSKEIFLLPLLCGTIFIVAGLIQYYFPPKKINSLYGYRTSTSMASQEKWEFAQKFSSVKLMQLGITLNLISPIGFVIELTDGTKLIIGILLALASVLVILSSTENALKNKFPKN